MQERKFKETTSPGRRKPEQTEKLLELLRAARAPEPSPEYLAAFWPRLREKLSPRRPAILRPFYYSSLAAAAAALVLWVTLNGPDGGGLGRPELPVYTLATASAPVARGKPELDYVSGCPRANQGRRSGGIDYVLPRIAERETGRLEV